MPPPDEGPPTLPPGLEPVRTPSGLEHIDVSVGKGSAAAEGARVRVRYAAWLPEGARVDSSSERGDAVSFVAGRGEVIAALEEGVLGMRPGGRRRLIVPSDLAYGPQGLGGRIPPYATLIVDLELVGVDGPPGTAKDGED